MVFCGEYEIPWKNLVVVAQSLLDFDEIKKVEDVYHFDSVDALPVLQIDNASSTTKTSGIFDHFRSFECTNQRDKVYALLSFPPLCELQPPIRPDYTKSVAEVFEEATMRIFQFSQSLGLLSSLEHDVAIEEGWPSWVPRWDRRRTTQVLHNFASGRAESSVPRINFKPGILISEGIRISTVSWCGSVIGGEAGSAETATMNILIKPLEEWLLEFPPKITDPADPLFLHTAMTLTVGLDLGSNCPPLDKAQLRLDFLAYLVDISPSLSLLGTTQHTSQILTEQALAGNSRNYRRAAARGSRNKRLIRTVDGELGVGPRTAQAGDHVVLLYGSNAPSVLRPMGSYYQYIGECYLGNHMYGEAIRMAAEGLVAAEEFELR